MTRTFTLYCTGNNVLVLCTSNAENTPESEAGAESEERGAPLVDRQRVAGAQAEERVVLDGVLPELLRGRLRVEPELERVLVRVALPFTFTQ